MRNPQGYATLQDVCGEGGTLVERDTFTCNHCQAIVTVEPFRAGADMGGFCTICAKDICTRCVGKGCRPWEAQMARMEASYEARRSYGI